MKKLVVLLSVFLCSCANPWVILDGSRNDATVELGYKPHLIFRSPATEDGVSISAEKCKDWGFESAKPLTDRVKYDNWKDGDDDVVIQKFQCTTTKGPPPLVAPLAEPLDSGHMQ